MPGPVSDSYDPEWGTGAIADAIRQALAEMHAEVSEVLGRTPPIYVGELLDHDMFPRPITTTLTERQWRLLRFACERAGEAI